MRSLQRIEHGLRLLDTDELSSLATKRFAKRSYNDFIVPEGYEPVSLAHTRGGLVDPTSWRARCGMNVWNKINPAMSQNLERYNRQPLACRKLTFNNRDFVQTYNQC